MRNIQGGYRFPASICDQVVREEHYGDQADLSKRYVHQGKD